ncbi:putative phospholipid-transporting atpase [Anaeramoeba ignava]|uniref:Phospholipid-transporting ATPase n=1 Tax=Anaeramoeba ignava TaxID=1746090 RepID=A0A9Q0LAD9_ANAIG|nr:putative phospholipid-transporting atpase [Anaeramoeba ignava]
MSDLNKNLIQKDKVEENLNEEIEKSITIQICDRNFSKLLKYPHNYISTTRYNWLNFIPKNLFEQFRRFANFYFLLAAILSFLPISPLTPFTSVSPLVFVLAVSAIKAGVEDYQRRKADKKANSALYSIYHPELKQFKKIRSDQIQMGDLIFLEKKQEIPADVIVISTSEDDNLCYIETSNLDGESNYKERYAIQETSDFTSLESFQNLSGKIKCEEPNEHIYLFEGSIQLDSWENPIALDQNQVLLRGSSLQNTKWVYGVVIYAGIWTKISNNLRSASHKFSKFETILNSLVLKIFFIQLSIVILSAFLAVVWQDKKGRKMTYLDQETTRVMLWKTIFLDSFGAYFIIYSYMIPISLYVTVECVRIVQSWFMQWDLEMYNEENGGRMVVKNSDLNEELGQIEIILSDKTGTLTENEMEIYKCSIGEKVYHFTNKDDINQLRELMKNEEQNLLVSQFFHAISLCHTVIPEYNELTKKNDFQGQSQDEVALVKAAKLVGIEMVSRKKTKGITLKKIFLKEKENIGEELSLESENEISIQSDFENQNSNQFQTFQIDSVLEFDSDRKRMSVVVLNPITRQYILYCKGADSSVIPKLSKIGNENIEKGKNSIYQFSKDGLRTLVIAYKNLEESQYLAWKNKFEKAKASLNQRVKKVHKVCDLIENDLIFLGVTGIMDRLQDGVPDTIASLIQAGIAFWVLTGDKRETAVSVAVSCNLIDKKSKIIYIEGQKKPEILSSLKNAYQTLGWKYQELELKPNDIEENEKEKEDENENENEIDEKDFEENDSSESDLNQKNSNYKNFSEIPNQEPDLQSDFSQKNEQSFSIVVTGQTLRTILSSLKQHFLNLAVKSQTVICCRVTPKQKAKVVELVRKKTNRLCLAIGDGANDVSMIQAANVGIGIFGKEGTQAARSSDYSLTRFRHLKRLLLVHGRYSFLRLFELILYSFYKNFQFILSQFWFSFFTGFSGVSLYDGWIMTLFNITFTFLPPFVFGFTEKDVKEQILMDFPQLYNLLIHPKKRRKLNFKIFSWRILNACYQSLVIFFVVYGVFYDNILYSSGKIVGFTNFGLYCAVFSIIIVNIDYALNHKYWNWLTHVSMWGTLAFLIVFLAVYSNMLTTFPEIFGVFYMAIVSPMFYLSFLFIFIACLLPTYFYLFYQRNFHPKDWQIIQEVQRFSPQRYKILKNQIDDEFQEDLDISTN